MRRRRAWRRRRSFSSPTSRRVPLLLRAVPDQSASRGVRLRRHADPAARPARRTKAPVLRGFAALRLLYLAEVTPKLYKASEVCETTGLQPYVLRSWEKEFPGIGVQKSQDSPRLYRQSDIEQVLRIKQLVFGEGLTLSGARRRLEEQQPQPGRRPSVGNRGSARHARSRCAVAYRARAQRPQVDSRGAVEASRRGGARGVREKRIVRRSRETSRGGKPARGASVRRRVARRHQRRQRPAAEAPRQRPGRVRPRRASLRRSAAPRRNRTAASEGTRRDNAGNGM